MEKEAQRLQNQELIREGEAGLFSTEDAQIFATDFLLLLLDSVETPSLVFMKNKLGRINVFSH